MGKFTLLQKRILFFSAMSIALGIVIIVFVINSSISKTKNISANSSISQTNSNVDDSSMFNISSGIANSGSSTTHSEITSRTNASVAPPKKEANADKNAIYVAKYGNDANDGSFERPFITPQKAIEVVRLRISANNIPTGGLTVYFMSGDYYLKSALIFNNEDSGTVSKPIKYSSYPNQKARLTGGVSLLKTDFISASKDTALNNLVDKNAISKIVKLDLKKIGITEYGNFTRRGFMIANPFSPIELNVNGKPMTVSRWPNNDSQNLVMKNTYGGTVSISGKGGDGPTIYFKASNKVGQRSANWKDTSDIWVDGILGQDWVWTFNKVKSINPSADTVTLNYGEVSEPVSWGVTRGVFFENILEELDSPGEYYIDKNNGILYFYPNDDFNNGASIYLSTLADDIISLDNAKNLIFDDLILSNSRGNGIVDSMFWIPNKVTQNITFKNITLENIAGNGISISGSNITVDSCELRNIGSTGIAICGGDIDKLTSSGNKLINNYIHDIGYFKKVYCPAVQISGVGNILKNNTIHNTTHAGIQITGNDNQILNNAIYNIGMKFRDMGVIYSNTGEVPYQRNNTIKNNYIKGYTFLASTGVKVITYGIYIDNGSQGYNVEKNIFDGVEQCAIFLNGGGYNVTKNNIIKNSLSPYFAQNMYEVCWADAIVKGVINKWISQKSKYTSLPYSNYPGLVEFYEALTPELTSKITNAVSYADYMNDPEYKNSVAFCQKGNTYTDTLIYNSPSFPRPANMTYFAVNGMISKPEIGAYISSEFGSWEPRITINNIKDMSTDPFNADVNGRDITITFNKVAIASYSIPEINDISADIGVRKNTQTGIK